MLFLRFFYLLDLLLLFLGLLGIHLFLADLLNPFLNAPQNLLLVLDLHTYFVAESLLLLDGGVKSPRPAQISEVFRVHVAVGNLVSPAYLFNSVSVVLSGLLPVSMVFLFYHL